MNRRKKNQSEKKILVLGFYSLGLSALTRRRGPRVGAFGLVNEVLAVLDAVVSG